MLGRGGVEDTHGSPGSKGNDVATDMDALAERFRDIRQEWDLHSGEVEAQAQNKALGLLHEWLKTGVDSPEVVIRAVQVLMADPEQPGIHRRFAVKQVIKPIAKAWESAGLNAQDIQILRGMILAAWPRQLNDGFLKLASLLGSAWVSIHGRVGKERYLDDWRIQSASQNQFATGTDTEAKPEPPDKATNKTVKNDEKIKIKDQKAQIHELADLYKEYSNSGNYYQMGHNVANKSSMILAAHQEAIAGLGSHINSVLLERSKIDAAVTALSDKVHQIARDVTTSQADAARYKLLGLMWWGQSRYSTALGLPYRRMTDATERVWWMSWESSALALNLDAEPAACFLVETLYQIDPKLNDQRRPLGQWVAELINFLRRIHAEGHHAGALSMSTRLTKIATDDAIGLPVTWARLEAARSKSPEGSLDKRIREEVAIDPETPIDLGEWAAWVFRESLVDRYLGAP